MSRRINVMIDDDTWGFLGRVPAGERSRTINEALWPATDSDDTTISLNS